MRMKISVTELRPSSGGSAAVLTVKIEDGEETQTIRGSVAAELLSELALPWQLTSPIEIDEEKCDAIHNAMEMTAAIAKGLSLLEYADNTQRGLSKKLKERGFSKDISDAAAEYLASHGVIDDGQSAALYAETLAQRRLYGRRRIEKELYIKGYDAATIRKTMASLEVDFTELCAKRLQKAGGLAEPADRKARQKQMAALMRYGFSYDEIREAARSLQEE